MTFKTTVFLSLLWLFLLCMPARAQKRILEFGPHAGLCSSRLKTNLHFFDEESRSGLMGGLFFRINMGPFYLQPEGNLMMKGGNRHFTWPVLHSPNSSDRVRECLKVTSVDVPVLFGLKLLNLGVANIRILGGPVASFLLAHQSDFSLNNQEASLIDFPEELEPTTWSVQFGAGIDLLMLSFDARYEIGMEDMSKVQGNEFRHSLFLVSLGWKFH